MKESQRETHKELYFLVDLCLECFAFVDFQQTLFQLSLPQEACRCRPAFG